MSTSLGKDGYLKVSTTTVAEVRDYTLTTAADTTDTTVIGDDWKTNKITQKSWNANGTLFWDESDAGQAELAIGTTVTLDLYPGGVASGAYYKRGSANVTQFDITGRHDSMVEASWAAEGNGALTTLTV